MREKHFQTSSLQDGESRKSKLKVCLKFYAYSCFAWLQQYCECLNLKTEMIIGYRAGIFCMSNDYTQQYCMGFVFDSGTHDDKTASPNSS